MTLSLSRMLSAEKSENDSAQSPAWSKKARPPATSAREPMSRLASPAKTSGGREARSFRTRSSSSSSGQTGCWAACRSRQRCGLHSGRLIPDQVKSSGAYARAVDRLSGEDDTNGVAPGSRIGVFGGTFDPVHTGHLVAATWAREELDLDRVLFVVAGEPWQKVGRRVV